MEALKAEIARKRKIIEELTVVEPAKKYFSKGDFIAKEREEYIKKFGLPLQGEEKTSVENKSDSAESNVDDHLLPRQEVITRLRDREEPILLFGETELDAFKRLRKDELLEPEARGFRNDFQEAMEKVDQDYLQDLLKNAKDEDQKKPSGSKEQKCLSHEEIVELSKKMGRGNREHDMTTIVHFINLILKLWNDQLQNRMTEEKMGTKGKLQRATYTQTQVYLKPLLRKLKSFSLPDDILDSLTEIVVHLLNRNYLKASGAYLQMAIGNAPWPIGVTMVGIHARTGREKIFSKNVAHVMNDETQRKYIQALKRLMTKCQEYFPTDPSKCVEYAAFGETQAEPSTSQS
ncbi:pre-mRNA-splicing factor 18 [Harmonia axyridis]|uniref:pre-mRNA-splicing factor 18 n=1 Tax=Harmonia axyridis TaxID=115357 RepID=UPI001E2760BF|nr:pre-mRNA-splicing factor 18 [Harmonia axyridis]